MGKNVFANGKEISAKKDDNQSICAMPDVCLSPPSPPAGPIPIPYPNTAMASDTNDGSKTVKIGGDEAGLKDASSYKKSTGDEAATKSFGMGVVTHTIQDKMRHSAWSMDVKFEGKNVIRHMDLTTHNHMNTQNSGSMTCNQASEKAAQQGTLSCEELDQANQDARANDLNQDAMKDQEKSDFALTTAVWKPPNGPGAFMRATSLNRDEFVNEDKRDGYAKEIGEERRPPCYDDPGDKAYNPQRKNDSETKLLDPLLRPPMAISGSMKMKIFHKDTKGRVDSMPCGSCKKSICGAQHCGIDITLCTQDNKEVSAKTLCQDGKPKPLDPPGADGNQLKAAGKARTKLWAAAGM